MPPKKKVSKNTKLPRPNPESVYDEAIPKTESMAHPVDPDEADAYWVARGNRIVPPAESWYPPRPPLRRDFDLSSKSSYTFLSTV